MNDLLFTNDFKENDNYQNVNKDFVFCCEDDIEYNEDIKKKDIYKIPIYFFKNKDELSSYPRILYIKK